MVIFLVLVTSVGKIIAEYGKFSKLNFDSETNQLLNIVVLSNFFCFIKSGNRRGKN